MEWRENQCATVASSTAATTPVTSAGETRVPNITAAANSATAPTWPAASGTIARAATRQSRPRQAQALASGQPEAGCRPCRAPAPATSSHGHQVPMAGCGQRLPPQQDAGATAASS